MNKTLNIALISIAIGILVFGLKYWAYWITGSVALFSDALESTVNVATALVTFIAIRVAAIPEDENHPYGHHKAELMSATFEGALIIIAAFVILWQAYLALMTPLPLTEVREGLAINLIAGIINGIWCYYLLREGQKLHSPALVADGKHLLTDVYSSLGVIAGIALAAWFGIWWLDGALAILVAANILWSGYHVVQTSLSGLMDEALSEADQATIKSIIAEHGSGAVQAHDLRTRQAGQAKFIDFHLVVPSDMTVFDAHELCDRIEAALKIEFAHMQIHIHLEPEHKAHKKAIEIDMIPDHSGD
ncbi:MAG: cation diffusion facilitator family transporter [Paracoccaceae bacterium]|jgi:cation diffusion facilitator family transporter